MDPLIKTTLLRTLGFFLMVTFSAWLFSQVERTGKDNSEEKNRLLNSLYKSMVTKYNMTIEEFKNFSRVAHEALSEPKPQWTFLASFEFVMTTLTTVGYGHITPQTPTGQILCILVSLIGIPITLLTLKSIGEVIARRANWIVTNFEKKILKRAEPKQVKTKSAVILIVFMAMTITACGFLFVHLENWTLLEGVYFSFITFSTIGFGDYFTSVNIFQSTDKLQFNTSVNQESSDEPADTGEYALKIFDNVLVTLNCLFGLCVVSSVLNSITESLEERKRCIRCILCPGCFPRRIQDHENREQNSTPLEQRGMDVTCMEHLQT